jgi:hypothetical protein
MGGPASHAARVMTVRTPLDLVALLERELEAHVQVHVGRSRSAPVRGRRENDGWVLHLHHAFLEADVDVIVALAAWLRAGRRARRAARLLDAFLETDIASAPAPVPRGACGIGEVHDLDELAAPIYDEFLASMEPSARPVLTWGRRGASRSRHTLRLGSYDPARGLVRMHRVLDQAGVPAWFVTAVLVHELLHAALPPVRDSGGRWIAHHGNFRRREAEWPESARSRVWEKQNIRGLIHSARTLEPLKVEGEAPSTSKGRTKIRTARERGRRRSALAWLQRGLFGDPA